MIANFINLFFIITNGKPPNGGNDNIIIYFVKIHLCNFIILYEVKYYLNLTFFLNKFLLVKKHFIK